MADAGSSNTDRAGKGTASDAPDTGTAGGTAGASTADAAEQATPVTGPRGMASTGDAAMVSVHGVVGVGSNDGWGAVEGGGSDRGEVVQESSPLLLAGRGDREHAGDGLVAGAVRGVTIPRAREKA